MSALRICTLLVGHRLLSVVWRILSQISAVFGEFRWTYQGEKGVLFFMFLINKYYSVKPGIVITGVSMNFLYSVMKYISYIIHCWS